MLAEMGLIAVMIKPGVVTYEEWIEALADRVSGLALKQDDPDEAAAWSSRALDLPEAGNPCYLGVALVTDNLNLLEHLNLAVIDGSPFPAQVKESNPDAVEAMEETDLLGWVDLASAMVSASGLD